MTPDDKASEIRYGARSNVGTSPAPADVADPLRSLRVVKWLTRLFVYPGVTLLIPLDHFLSGLTWNQALSVHLGGYIIATIAIELAYDQAFKLRRHAAYPNVLVMGLGEAQTEEAAARQVLPVLNRLLNLRASFMAIAGGPDKLRLASTHGVGRGRAERLLEAGAHCAREAMQRQRPVSFGPEKGERREDALGGNERLVFIPVIAPQKPLGVLAVVGGRWNRDLKDAQLLGNIGVALGLSLENIRQTEGLRDSEARLRVMVQQMPAVLWTTDSQLRFTSSLGAGLAALHLLPNEVLGVTLFEYFQTDDPHFPPIAAHKRALTGETATYQLEWRERAFHCHVESLRDAEGRSVGCIGVALDVTQHRQAEEALHRREEEFKALVENAPDIIARFDREFRHVYANPAVERVFEAPPEEIIGKTHAELGVPEELYSYWQTSIRAVFETGEENTIEYATPGGRKHYQSRLVPEFAEDGSIAFVLTITRDITEHKRAEGALRESETKFRTLADTVAAAAFIFQGTQMRYVNSAAEAVTGYSRQELLAMDFWDVIHPDFREMVKERGLARQRGEPVPSRYEVKILTKSGAERWVDFMAGAIEFEGKPGVLGTAFDITERKQAEETIKQLAYHDALTGLPNRTLFEDRLSVALAQVRRKKQVAAVMFLDLDRFKVVNDTVGHALGDRLLQSVAERLQRLVREGDTVARVGGDEFTLLLPDVTRTEDVVEVAERVLATLRQPWLVNGHEFHITTSIGIAMCPSDGEDVESLLSNADTAMYRAKDRGRDNYKLYAPTMNARVAERLALENSLRHGLEREEFVVFYQPQVDIVSGRIVGVEALVRWQHPELGLVLPGEFIAVAEETGLIVPLGAEVLQTACAQNKAWQEAGLPPVRVAVNLSARQFQLPDLTKTVARVLAESGLEPRYLQLEITEGAAMQDVEFTVTMLRELREMGVQISIDDFGTGHSSLSYLKRLPIDVVKIDQSFVRDLTLDPNDAAIASSVIVMAHNLKLRVIAEGVETEEQLAFLKEHGCDEIQGYLFSRPAPAAALEGMLRGDGGASAALRPARAGR